MRTGDVGLSLTDKKERFYFKTLFNGGARLFYLLWFMELSINLQKTHQKIKIK